MSLVATRYAPITNASGEYAFPSLPPGIYTVTAEKPGFKTLVRSQVEIQVQDRKKLARARFSRACHSRASAVTS